jgi:hypothetical protein
VCRYSTDDVIAGECGQGPEVLAAKQFTQICIAERGASLFKGFRQYRKQPPRVQLIVRAQSFHSDVHFFLAM